MQSWKVACAQVINYIHSYYIREGKLTKSQEKLVVCKLAETNKAAVLEMIKKQHPHQVPEILIESKECNEDYGKRVEETKTMKSKTRSQ